jgi:hypothetical protein
LTTVGGLAARARLTVATAILSVVMLISAPLATDAGEWLERRVNSTELVRTHTTSGDTMLPWAIALTVVALVLLARELLAARARRGSTPVAVGGGPGTTRTRQAGSDRSDTVALWGGRGVSVDLAAIAVVVCRRFHGHRLPDRRLGCAGGVDGSAPGPRAGRGLP